MLLNSTGGMNMYEKEQDAEFNLYQKAHPGLYSNDFDPMSFEMTKIPMQLQFHQQQRAQHEQRRERKKMPVEEHEHWVALVWAGSSGKAHIRSSSKLRYCKGEVLEEAMAKFSYYVNQVKGGGFGFEEGLPFEARSKSQLSASRDNGPRTGEKRRRQDVESSDDGRRSTYHNRDDDPNDNRSSDVYYRADAKEDWAKWFYNAFRAVQQQACRTIAKEWIKTIHPKKQSTHPYNGKNPKTGERGDPATTKPPYWPAYVKHKEPDHINKEDRTQLLVHLLMSTPHVEMSISGEPRSTKEITAEMLKEPLDTKKHENVNKELLKRFHIVQSIIEVRTQLESFEAGGIAGDTMVSAPDYSGYNRGTRAEDEFDDAEEEEGPDAGDSNDMTDDTDGHTELASEDADYVLLSRQTVPQGSSQTDTSKKNSERRKSKSRHVRGGRAEDAQTASFMSTVSNTTAHSIAPPQSGVNDASSISPEWHMLPPGKSDQHAIPSSHMYATEHMWRHPMGMQMQPAPFPEHGLISPPPQYHMNGVGLPVGGVAIGDGRYMGEGGYCHPPMHSGSHNMRHHAYPDMHDPQGLPIRSPTPQALFMGHPTPPMNGDVSRVYY